MSHQASFFFGGGIFFKMQSLDHLRETYFKIFFKKSEFMILSQTNMTRIYNSRTTNVDFQYFSLK